MKFKEIIIQFEADNLILAEELICDIFFSFNIKGVVCDIPLAEPDEGFGTNTLLDHKINSITGFLPVVEDSDSIFEKIQEKTAKLTDSDITTRVNTRIIDEKEWSESWKTYFDVTPITDRITIKPEWKIYDIKNKDEIVICLDPGMAFGTGTHPSTAMCIKMIETYLTPGSTFMDVGTGSGILMITAARLGASHVYGIDNDKVAVNVARQNLFKNHISPEKYDLFCTILDNTIMEQYHLIAVNIIAQIIIEMLPEIVKRMTKESITIFSGIIKERRNSVLDAINANHLYVIHEEYTDDWLTLAVKKKQTLNTIN